MQWIHSLTSDRQFGTAPSGDPGSSVVFINEVSLRLAWGYLLVPAIAACTTPSDSDRTRIRDSANIAIVDNGAPAWRPGDGWRVGSSPAVLIGGEEPETQFDRIRGAMRLSDGSIVVALGRGNELRYFDSNGQFTARVGGAGSGPGEFRGLTGIVRLEGDSILAFDPVLMRLSVFTPSRMLAREVSLNPIGSGLELLGVLPGGQYLLGNPSALVPEGQTDGVVRYPRRYFVYSRDGASADTVATYPGFEFEVRFNRKSSNWSAMEIPLGRNTVSVVRNGRWHVGNNARFEIQQLDVSGRVTKLLRYAAAERRLTASMVDSFEQISLSQLEPADSLTARAIKRLFREVEAPQDLPAFRALHLTPDGYLVVTSWVMDFGVPDAAPRTWWVFDPAGVLMGSVTAPRSFTLFDIGIDYVLGTLTDSDGVQRIALYDLERPRN